MVFSSAGHVCSLSLRGEFDHADRRRFRECVHNVLEGRYRTYEGQQLINRTRFPVDLYIKRHRVSAEVIEGTSTV